MGTGSEFRAERRLAAHAGKQVTFFCLVNSDFVVLLETEVPEADEVVVAEVIVLLTVTVELILLELFSTIVAVSELPKRPTHTHRYENG